SADQPNAYMEEILRHGESPVLLLPDGSGLPNQLVMAYDGSASSVHAIRQFVYLFPELCDRPVTVVNLVENPAGPMPDSGLLYEWLVQHFKGVALLQLPMTTEDFLVTWMGDKDAPWLIAGSYGRSGWSQLFAKSFVAESIRRPAYPVFLAHL
ncbi:MAG TPA: universal stress protein, partial [Puia sp.]|nr:universal stress protein [Puia sp.]